MGFVETSAKTGINIDFAFKKIVEGYNDIIFKKSLDK